MDSFSILAQIKETIHEIGGHAIILIAQDDTIVDHVGSHLNDHAFGMVSDFGLRPFEMFTGRYVGLSVEK